MERGRKAQLVAAAEEAVAKARVADPALAAPWALAALVKLASWEQGLAGKGALRGAWEDALLAVKSHAPVSSFCCCATLLPCAASLRAGGIPAGAL